MASDAAAPRVGWSTRVPWGAPTAGFALFVEWGAILFAGLLWIAGPAESLWAVVGILSLWLRYRHGQAAVAWGREPPRAIDALLGIGVGVGVLGFDFVASVGLETVAGTPPAMADPLLAADVPPILMLLAIAVAVPVAEEYVFRGVVFQGLARRLPVFAAAGISAGLFGLGHVWTWDLWGVFPAVSAFVFGLVMTWLFVRRGNLLGPIVAHATVNGAVVGVALLMPPTFGLMLDPVGTAATCQMAFVTSESLETIQRAAFARTRTIDTSGPGWRNFRDDLATLEQTATRSGSTTAIELTSVWVATADEQESAITAGREPDFGAVFMAGADLLLACATAGHQPLDPPAGDAP